MPEIGKTALQCRIAGKRGQGWMGEGFTARGSSLNRDLRISLVTNGFEELERLCLKRK